MALSTFSGSSDSVRISRMGHPIWDMKVIVLLTVNGFLDWLNDEQIAVNPGHLTELRFLDQF